MVEARARSPSFPATVFAAGGLLISARHNADTPRMASANFAAEVSGAITGRVSGPGLVRFLPPTDAGFRSVPGYFFVADDAGVRDLGITFMIPTNTEPGTYELVSAHPMDAGKNFEVRVDRSVGNRTASFEANTTGTIRMESFPTDAGDLPGHPIEGSFDSSTRDWNGREVAVRGSFHFPAGQDSRGSR